MFEQNRKLNIVVTSNETQQRRLILDRMTNEIEEPQTKFSWRLGNR